jgi:hypothetical protein
MCSTCCALGVVGVYREDQLVVVTGVVSRQCGKLVIKEKIILKWLRGRMNSEYIRVA